MNGFIIALLIGILIEIIEIKESIKELKEKNL